jgi:membrane protein implicated in regulation of membrane protease activity
MTTLLSTAFLAFFSVATFGAGIFGFWLLSEFGWLPFFGYYLILGYTLIYITDYWITKHKGSE